MLQRWGSGVTDKLQKGGSLFFSKKYFKKVHFTLQKSDANLQISKS
jgi:hypothetical protein